MGVTAEKFSSDCCDVGLDPQRYPSLLKAMDYSDGKIQWAREAVREEIDTVSNDIVVFGSLARREMTRASDFDYLVIAYKLGEAGATRKALAFADGGLREGLGAKEPGGTGLFGDLVSATELAEVIGLQRDTNHSQTRRILLLQESVSLGDNALHKHLVTNVIDRYLETQKDGTGSVPRFLLNDICKYWRTIAVDYQAKASPEARYSLRYLKLIIPRKISYAAALAPLMMSEEYSGNDQRDFLVASYMTPPAVRLVEFMKFLQDASVDNKEVLRQQFDTIYECLDRFIDLMGEPERREVIDRECKGGDPENMPTFNEARDVGRRLDSKLTELFMTGSVQDFTRRYLVF